MAESVKLKRYKSANLIDLGAEKSRIWEFAANNGSVTLTRQQTSPVGTPVPSPLQGKNLRSLFSNKLNIAWLNAESVFLRVLQIPASNLDEVFSMVELQLEKISPLPVNQILWSIELLSKGAEGLQTVVVIIVPRDVVERFLGRLEQKGYLADRLELPQIGQLSATKVSRDGIWFYPEPGKLSHCIIAWWYGGILQNLSYLNIATGVDHAGKLKDQLLQVSWAAELEGWLTEKPLITLVGDETTAQLWLPILDGLSESPVEVVKPAPSETLAASTVTRAVRSDPRTNLLPAEYAAKYRQEYIDRLWMRGAGAIILAYIVGVVIYFAALEVIKFKADKVQQQVRALSGSYTNAIQLKEKIGLLKEQVNLKFAALESYKAVVENLPPDLTLTSLIFQKGTTLSLRGTVPSDQLDQLYEYNEKLRSVAYEDRPLFKSVKAPRQDKGGGNVSDWSFVCELNKNE